MLTHLRGAGHQVSLVQELDEAQVILKSGDFDLALLPAHALVQMLEERLNWASSGAEEWRSSVFALAHDIQSLLAVLERSISLLQSQQRGDLAGRDVDGIQQSIVALSSLLRELATELAGEHASDHLATFELEDLLEAAAMSVYPSAAARGQRLSIDVDEPVKAITADGLKLRRILTKILQYASRQGSDKGIVAVRACRDQDDCVISVSLPGHGITRSELRQMFAPSSAGSANSLAYEQKLVDHAGGRLWIESENHVTAVFVSFPLAPAAAASHLEI